ncbi:MAG TPA: hypothetical protein VJP02_12655, partial [Candidatus Sulfotelmatobacter sp.]|nr:hypothetical protein [Candidatus Sulfotelmatobacter sp.]
NAMSNDRSCTHIKVTGVRCNSPALRGEQFCYFHQNAHRGVRRPPQSRLHPIAMIEDEESIQYALMEVINALMRNTIDIKRASLIIRALHIAVKNASRVKFSIHAKDTVTQIPDYPAPTPEHETIAQQSELPAVSAIPYKPVESHDRHFWEYQAEGGRVLAREAQARAVKDCVGTDALVRPASAASVPADSPATPAATSLAHTYPNKSHSEAAAAPKQAPLTKKPPATATAPAPKERKIAAHRASGR